MHRNGVEFHLGPLVRGIESGDRAERGDPRVVAQDADLASGQFGDEGGPSVAIRQIARAHVDLDAVLVAQGPGE